MYKMMSALEIAKHIIDNNLHCVNFTFDVIDEKLGFAYTLSGEPERWHGIKIIKLFDCQTYTIAIGSYGGYTVKYYESPYFREMIAEQNWLAKMIYSYFKDEDEFDSQNKKVCVEV